MDDYVRNTLIKWSLPDLIPRFKGKPLSWRSPHFSNNSLYRGAAAPEEQVNSLAFQHLTDDMMKELVPRVGRRAIFRYKYLEFKRQKEEKNVSGFSLSISFALFTFLLVHTDTVHHYGEYDTGEKFA